VEDIIAIIMVFGTAMVGVVAFSPIGKAIAERLRHRPGEPVVPVEEIDELRDQLAGLREQVSELAERQDFAERLLSQARERGALGPGAER
jgi:hypothetical protein